MYQRSPSEEGEGRDRAPFLSASTQQAVIIVLLLAVVYTLMRGAAGPAAAPALLPPPQPNIIAATPTLGLPPVPTLIPTPVVIYVERPAAPAAAPIIIDDHSINVCIGICPDGSR